MKVDLTKCTEIVPGVFKKIKAFYIKDITTGKIVYCNQEKINKLVEKYGSIENVGNQFTTKKTTKKETINKNLVKSSVKTIEATLINDSGKKVATFVSIPINQNINKIIYKFNNAKFKQEFIFVIKFNKKLFPPVTKRPMEIKVELFNGHTKEVYDAVYDKEENYYCVINCDAAIQLLSIVIDHKK